MFDVAETIAIFILLRRRMIIVEFKISRRDMLKMVGGAVAAYSLGSLAETPAATAAENKCGIRYNGNTIPVL